MPHKHIPPRRRRSSKGIETRERIYSVAVQRFQAEGYTAASLRSIAKHAGVTPALLYRYFDSKDALVAELYGRLLDEWVRQSAHIPKGTWIERSIWLTRLSMQVLEPYRKLLRALLGPMLDGDPIVSPLHNEDSRSKGQPQFLRAVSEATDAPRDATQLAEAAYLGQLGVLFFWVVDRSREQIATRSLLKATTGLAPLLNLGLKMPFIRPRLLALTRSIQHGLLGDGAAQGTP